METLPLPGLEPPPAKPKPIRPAQTPRITYSKVVSAQRLECWECIEHRMNGEDVPVRQSRYVRVGVDGVERYLCMPHTQEFRARDGLAEIRERRK